MRLAEDEQSQDALSVTTARCWTIVVYLGLYHILGLHHSVIVVVIVRIFVTRNDSVNQEN